MIKKYIYSLIASLTLLITAAGCADDIEYRVDAIPEGHTQVTFDVDFREFTPALTSRTAGDVIKAIEMLWVVIYDTDGNFVSAQQITEADGLTTSVESTTRPDGAPSTEEATGHASFKLTLPNGRYQMFAVANLDLANRAQNTYDTIEKLRWTRLYWDSKHPEHHSQMFGQFHNTSDDISDVEGGTVTVGGGNTHLYAWLRRCVSKVTVAYDGSKLKDGVSVYLMGVTIKDIPLVCSLGKTNTVNSADSLIAEGELIKYCQGNESLEDPSFINGYPATLSNKEGQRTYGSDHSDEANALFFFENMQGVHENVDKTQQDKDGNGVPDNADRIKDEVPYGTYIEVEALYRSTNPDRPTAGVIKYRFMLGKDIYHDFNAERNHHYKLTLHLRGYANEFDWHVDYDDQVLTVTPPLEFDYRGMVFQPDMSVPNRDHTFSPNNSVIVGSYLINDMGRLEDYTITYRDSTKTSFSATSDWLTVLPAEDGRFPYEEKLTFVVKPERTDVVPIDIDAKLKAATQKGTADKPFNLANPTATPCAPADAKVNSTANCYIVSAKGYYLLPLVYGNGIINGQPNKSAWEPGSAGINPLGTFKNHLNQPIKEPYIRDNTGCNPARATVLLQDEDNLIPYDVWLPTTTAENVRYIPEAYGGKGGIEFYIGDNIQQGNAIIGIIDDAVNNAIGANALVTPNNQYVMWSWHIWVTSLDGIDEAERNIKVQGFKQGDETPVYDFMPMNLGWCSNHGDKIKYYPERRCEVKFKSGPLERTIKIVQRSHIAFTCGNSTYYQWGRKDPFFGVLNATSAHNKARYLYTGWSDVANYACINGNQWSDAGRLTTENALGECIKYPYKWHNPPREAGGYDNNDFRSLNKTYSNLWGGQTAAIHASVKTVYDPCPVGYKVAHYDVFRGFTTRGVNTGESKEWYNTKRTNVSDYDVDSKTWTVEPALYTENLYEFYTTPAKTQSIMFPLSGYRDWDNGGYGFRFGEVGYTWTASVCANAFDLSGGNYSNDDDWAFNFGFSYDYLNTSFIRPNDVFFSCDAFPIRPVKHF